MSGNKITNDIDMNEAERNMHARFVDNPHRGIALGMNEDQSLIQLSWIMGRSSNSQNRIYTVDGRKMFTEAADSSKVKDPSLIIYNAMDSHIPDDMVSMPRMVVSNGAQTDTIIRKLGNLHLRVYDAFKAGVNEHYCEPDEPIFTPRISGVQSAYGNENLNQIYMAIQKAELDAKQDWITMKKSKNMSPEKFMKEAQENAELAKKMYLEKMTELTELDANAFPTRTEFYVLPAKPGFGYCITTYDPNDSKTLPSFTGEPFLIPMNGTLEDIMKNTWAHLEPEWKVSLGGRELQKNSSTEQYAKPINRFEKVQLNE